MMQDEEDFVEIDLDDAKDAAPKADAKVEDVKPEPIAKPKADDIAPEVVDSLKKQLDAIKAERDAAQQARAQAELDAKKLAQAAQQAKSSADQSYYQLVNGYVNQAKSKSEQLRRDIKLALDGGEYDKAAELQMEAARVAARQLQYEDAKADLEAKAERAKSEPQSFEITKTHSDVFEDQIKILSEPSKNWLRNHKECILDDVANAKVLLGDKLARRQGLVPDSKEYFDFIEEHMGYKQKPQVQKQEAEAEESDDGVVVEIAEPKPVAKRPLSAAPVSREAGHQGKPTSGKVYLSKAEAEIAENLGMSKAEYAKWKIKVEHDNRYTN